MKRSRPLTSLASPFLLRTDLAVKTGEMMLASAQAIAMQLMKMNPLPGARAARQMLTSATAVMSLAASRTAGEAMKRQAAVIRTITQSAGAASRLSGSTARVAQGGLKPIHARATANARRSASSTREGRRPEDRRQVRRGATDLTQDHALYTFNCNRSRSIAAATGAASATRCTWAHSLGSDSGSIPA